MQEALRVLHSRCTVVSGAEVHSRLVQIEKAVKRGKWPVSMNESAAREVPDVNSNFDRTTIWLMTAAILGGLAVFSPMGNTWAHRTPPNKRDPLSQLLRPRRADPRT